MKQVFAILSIFLIFNSCDTATTDLAVDDKVFFKYYGGEYREEGIDVVQTSDLGYLIVGTTTSPSLGSNKDIMIIKTDERGKTEWTKIIEGQGEDIARKIKKLPDEGFIIVGDITTFLNDTAIKQIILIRLDSHGNEIWRRIHVYQKNAVYYNTEGGDVAINEQGQFLVAGQVALSSIDSEILFFVADGNGYQISELTLIGQENTLEHATSILPDPTGKNWAYIAGYTNYGESQGQDGYNMFIVSINRDGSVPFPNIMGDLDDEFGEMMISTIDNKFMVLGSESDGMTSKVFLNKIDLKIDTEWKQYIDIPGIAYIKGTGISIADDGYVILAEMKVTGIDSNIILIKTDLLGNLVWEEKFKVFGGNYYDKGNSVTTDLQGNIVITGQCAFNALGNNAKLCLIKARNDGELKP